LYRVQYSPSDFMLLKHLWTHIRSFLSLRAAFFSYSSNINAVVANFLFEKEGAAYLMKIITSLRNYHVLVCKVTEHDGQCEHRVFWPNGNVTHSVNRP
jgi:hypothetical protein